MRLAIIAEKPLLADAVRHFVGLRFPEFITEPVAEIFATPYVTLNSSFRYPRGLTWSQYPVIQDPEYKPIDFGNYALPRFRWYGEWFGQWQDDRRVAHIIEKEKSNAWARNGLRSAELILVLNDADPSSALSTWRVLTTVFPEGIPYDWVLAPRIISLGAPDIIKSLKSPASFAEVEEQYLPYARLRRLFDYNFNLNSLAIFGKTLRLAGGEADQPITKFGLQFLFALRDRGPISEGEAIQMMQKWAGTGRYDASPTANRERWTRFGSAASRSTILEGLTEVGLVSRREIQLTEAGQRFLTLVHKDCEDADLPFRLEEWCRLPEEEAHTKIKGYLRRFFDRQKRYLDKASALPA